jgi:hypothetical protein
MRPIFVLTQGLVRAMIGYLPQKSKAFVVVVLSW